MADGFDRMLGLLHGLPDVIEVQPRTVRVVTPLTGDAQTYIIQTKRQKDQGDYLFLEHVAAGGTTRIVIPPDVTAAIAIQREAITARSRKRAARQAAATRRERGIVPTFGRPAALKVSSSSRSGTLIEAAQLAAVGGARAASRELVAQGLNAAADEFGAAVMGDRPIEPAPAASESVVKVTDLRRPAPAGKRRRKARKGRK